MPRISSRRCAAWDTSCLRYPRILRAESLRLAALFALLFVALTGALVVTVLWMVDSAEREGLRAADRADIAAIGNGYRDEGEPEAIEVVRQLLGSAVYRQAHPSTVYIALAERSRGELAGNFTVPERRLGDWDAPSANGPLLGVGEQIAPDLYVFVGRATRGLAATRERILRAFAWLVSGAVVIAIGAGVLFGLRFMRRVDAISRTCEAIVDGRFAARIALQGGDNEWDRLGAAINGMLDRIATLMDDLRQMSSDVAHDLRTPLTRLRVRLENTRREALSTEDYAAAVAHAIEDTDQILAMFAAVLRISQIEAGSRAADFAPVGLSDLLGQLAEMYRPAAEDGGQVLLAGIEAQATVLGDAELLTQMFSNLIENAIRHTPRGTRIRIELQRRAGTILAAVSDDGPGIPREEHAQVLKRFYRLSNSRAAPGHGLGLSLVAAIAALHRAQLTLADLDPGLRVGAAFRAL